MAGRKPQLPLQHEQLRCTNIVHSLLPYREQLWSQGPAVHGNTQLRLGDVPVVLLASFFNPLVRSQRLIEQLSQMDWVRPHLDVEAVRRSTLSDALRRFDPQQLSASNPDFT